MWRNRLGFALTLALLAVLLLAFSKPFLLIVLLTMVLTALVTALLAKRDALNLQTHVRLHSGVREGDIAKMTFAFASRRQLLAANSILVELNVRNEMFGFEEHKSLLFELDGRQSEYTIGVPMVLCGRVEFQCVSVQIRDLFGLFCMKAAPFDTVRAVTYPRQLRLVTELSDATIGATRTDGMMQNRKGSDPSEMFDIREYVPGDDVRTIHWKLSGKTDNLIVRQASDPSHYNIALLPDFGRVGANGPVSREELNTAAAIAASIGEQLIRRAVPFCCVLPAENGVELYDVHTEHEFNELLPRWLSFPIQEHAGAGLQYFVMEHLDRYFTRLLIFSAGRYEQPLGGLDNRVGIMVLSAVSEAETVRMDRAGSCELLEIPTDQKENEEYRVLC